MAASLSAQPVFAQALEEITVTARKTEESLQDVPISITAFGAQQLLDMGAFNNDDVARMTVNFNTVSQIGRRLDRPVIRGMASPATFGEPNASYFVDGAYISGSIAATNLGPIERVEILRGPQSAQFGRATFPGAVNYVTRKPTNELTGEALARVGNNDSRVLSGWVSGPVIEDTLLFFGSASWDRYGGEWQNNLQPNTAFPDNLFIDPPQQADFSDLGKTDTKQAVGKLMWNITDTSDLMLKVGYTRGEDGHYPQLVVETSELNCFVPGQDLAEFDPVTRERNLNYYTSPGQACGVISPEGRENRLNIPDLREGINASATDPALRSTGELVGLRRDQYNVLLEYTQDIADWSLTARAAWNKDDFETSYDLDGTEARPLLGLFSFYETKTREDNSFELRLASPVASRLRGSLGVYYFDFEEESRQKSHVGLLQAQLSDPYVATTENLAVFGSVELDLTDVWTFTAEARYAEDTKEIQSPNVCEDTPSNREQYIPPGQADEYLNNGQPIRHEETTDAVTPRFTLRYQGWENATVYVQAAKGNKPGAFNTGIYSDGRNGCQTQLLYRGYQNDPNNPLDTVPDTVPIAFVEEENAWTYEVGAKTSWLDKRLTANVAFFYIDWDNLTAFETRFIEINGLGAPQSLGLNAGKATVKGLELETKFAFTDKLVGTFSYGYNDGEYDEFASKAFAETTGIGLIYEPADPNGPFDPNGIEWDPTVNNLKGAQIPNSSKHNFVTSLTYNDQFTADLGWFARTDFVYESKKYTSGTNFEQIGNRRVWNARTGLEHSDWRLSLYINNILDEQTQSAIIGFPRLLERNASNIAPNGYLLTPTRGRQIGAEAVFRFGS